MTETEARVSDLVAEFGRDDASAAWLLCDRHPRSEIAFAIVDDSATTEFTFGELADASIRLADSFVQLGLAAGDRIATLVRKGPELVITMLAAWRIGAVYVPLFTAFGPGAIAFRLERAAVKLVITDGSQRAKLDGIQDDKSLRIASIDADSASDDLSFAGLIDGGRPVHIAPFTQGAEGPIVHTFTSGTTGEPKGVIHPLAYVAGWVSYQEFALGVGDGDVYWCAADPGWAYGLYAGIISPLATGVSNILQVGGFSPERTWSILAERGVTNFTAAPTVYRALRASDPGENAASLRLQRLSSAGEPLTPEVNEWTESAFGLTVHDHYGQTEVGMIFANPHHPAIRRPVIPGSMGHALPGWVAEVLGSDGEPVPAGASGELAIDMTSPFMTFHAYQDPTKGTKRFTRDRRYFRLGDLGRRDEEGYIHFSSRDDDVILMAGYRIGPFDVESVISRHSAVAECAVVAAPDEARGEVVEAFVVLKKDATGSAELVEEIQAAVKDGYSAHAYPRRVHFVDSLPKTPSGKIQRFILREQRRAESERAHA